MLDGTSPSCSPWPHCALPFQTGQSNVSMVERVLCRAGMLNHVWVSMLWPQFTVTDDVTYSSTCRCCCVVRDPRCTPALPYRTSLLVITVVSSVNNVLLDCSTGSRCHVPCSMVYCRYCDELLPMVVVSCTTLQLRETMRICWSVVFLYLCIVFCQYTQFQCVLYFSPT